MQEVVRAEVLKLLQAGIIYPISDSPWVSPTQVVPKKSGSQWCKMIRERKFLHTSLQVGGSGEDHFHLFIRNLAYRRMSFGLCNAPQHSKMHVKHFNDMVERIMESLWTISQYMECV
ncbi:hypothetical protein CK203_014574 [Vitis vinifera]|uniref:Uncharacterized protein n=1 Tax=Vitis vinifera TaxID=29760 RepID=A0A438K4S0_VITVI|nr:hypothetical protein CK203_014574 [Vitis vinifera]